MTQDEVGRLAHDPAIGRSTPLSAACRDGLLVAGVGVAHDAGARIGGEHAMQARRPSSGAVGDHHHAGVDL